MEQMIKHAVKYADEYEYTDINILHHLPYKKDRARNLQKHEIILVSC